MAARIQQSEHLKGQRVESAALEAALTRAPEAVAGPRLVHGDSNWSERASPRSVKVAKVAMVAMR